MFKNLLTPSQSATLIAKGISADKASFDSCATAVGSAARTPTQPIFTLADICELLPKGVIHNGMSCKLRITSWYDEPYFAGYENQVGKYIMGKPYDAPFSAEELIDALYELLIFVLNTYPYEITNK